jgi:RNA polymerase sigma-70 factor (ECF subfamily)
MQPNEVRRVDDPLVDAARDGNQRAFGELVRRHQNEVFTLALRLTADRELAADVAQEAFVRAWRALGKFRGDAQFSTWLHRITVNTGLTMRRRAGRHRADSIDDVIVEPEASGITPEMAGEATELRERLVQALRTLPTGNREVVVLKDVHGWSHGEIAEHLDISVTAAKVRLHRGRRVLRERLFDVGGGEPS